MAKHPHRLLLIDKKTWRCTLPGCAFFVHLGLAHVIEGKTILCWNCGEQFTATNECLKDEMPKCDECRSNLTVSHAELGAIADQQIALTKQGVQSVDELKPHTRRTLEALGLLKPEFKTAEELAELEKEDQIESED